jgi:hypothetical protein
MAYTIKHDSYGNGGFAEWWDVIDDNDERFARCDAEEAAEQVALLPDLVDVLNCIVANASLQPDSRMKGVADIYAVPIEDIERGRAILASKQEGEEE